MVREMVKNHDIVISNRPRNIAPSVILYDGNDVGFAPYGEYWKQARKISVVELLSVKRVQEFQRMRDEENGRADEGDDGAVRSFQFRRFLSRFEWMDVVRGLSGRLKSASRKMDEFLDQVIEEHKANLVEKKDFVDILLRVQNQKDEILSSGLTQQDIKGILADMFVAGADTTSTVMEWLMAELVRNPEVMKKAQEESLDKHLRASNWEATIFQQKPEEFIPERFENSDIDFKGQDFQFSPFGTGRKGCPGMTFGITVKEYVIANLLYWFDWKLPGGALAKDLDMTEAHRLTVFKKHPFHLLPIPYNCSPSSTSLAA
ncbi:hypothetical protein FNV43_RR21536 [Rhamnella rubrinervis]|uniref:Cytochrome P450 n=1 Tax=Rhamnella rubrinervis TaxID=2594499 RepID=A0A8K0E8L9_9ROSA|nr:hypothetical protein FNV43_RR21536 [Rhamnella rubrinervis]